MWVNIDTVPAGKAMYTIAITDQPADTPPDLICYDEVDVVLSTHLTAREVVRRAEDELARDYASTARVIGVSNESDGYIMWQNRRGDLRQPA